MNRETAPSSPSHRVLFARWRETFFAQKYRFDLGQSSLVVVNFALLIITASDKLQRFFGIPNVSSLVTVVVPLGFIGVWLLGYFMDKIVHAPQMAERQTLKRSEIWTRHTAQMDRIEEELKQLRQLIENRKD